MPADRKRLRTGVAPGLLKWLKQGGENSRPARYRQAFKSGAKRVRYSFQLPDSPVGFGYQHFTMAGQLR